MASNDRAGMMFRMLNESSNGRITRAEWEELFERMAGDKGFLTPDDLRDALFPPAPDDPKPPAQEKPSRFVLLKGLLAGELGSPFEGPPLGAKAPPFTLRTPDGKKEIALQDLRGKPVVLVFGSFT